MDDILDGYQRTKYFMDPEKGKNGINNAKTRVNGWAQRLGYPN